MARWPALPPLPAALAGRMLRQVAVGLLVGAGLLLVAGLALEAKRQFQNLRTAGLDNVQWTAMQLEVDTLRVIVAIDDAAADPAALDGLRTRFDILYSRFNILSRGAIYAEVLPDPEISAGLDALAAFLDRHVGAIDGPDPALMAALPALRADSETLHGAVRAMIIRTLEHFSRQADRQRGELAELLQRAALVTAGLLTLLVALLLLLSRLYARQEAAQTALREARDAALAGQRAKASFVAVMSHEMRTPLNGILASLEIVRNDMAEPKQARFVALAHASALQLMDQINDVLDISRIEAGRVEIAPTPLALHDFLAETVSSLRPLAEARGNSLELALAPDVPAAVWADSFRLRQILQNFLSNAIKFTESGRIVLSVTRCAGFPGDVPDRTPGETRDDAPLAGDRCLLELAVSDTGVGIAPEDLRRVFEDFVMLDPTYSREVGGSGLGLAICRRLAEALGGDIGVDSRPGAGSRFWVRLPFAAIAGGVVPALPAAAAARMGADGAEPVAAGAGLRLLVVDDNAVNRTVIAQMLADLGHEAHLAATGREAVDRARARRYDAILMDISMPEMDGVTAARHVRAGGASADVPIFALTAHAMPDELARFEAAGLRTTLLKPVRMQALRRALAGVARATDPAVGTDAAIPGAPAQRGLEDPPAGGAQLSVAPVYPPTGPAYPSARPAPAAAVPPSGAPLPSAVSARPACAASPAAGMLEALPLIDAEARAEQLDLLGPEPLAAIIAQFVQDADRLLSDLEAAVAAGDTDLLRRRAHEFKGAGATLGFLRLAAALQAMEAAAEAREAGDRLAARLASVQTAWAETGVALAPAGHRTDAPPARSLVV